MATLPCAKEAGGLILGLLMKEIAKTMRRATWLQWVLTVRGMCWCTAATSI